MGVVGRDGETAWVGRGCGEEFGVGGEKAMSEHEMSGKSVSGQVQGQEKKRELIVQNSHIMKM